VAAGQSLKLLRKRLNITVRDVQQASRRIAAAKGDKRYRLSNGWLVQLENRASPPNIHHLFALSAIYRVPFRELGRLYGIDIDELEKYEAIANPQRTQLLAENSILDVPVESAIASTNTRLAPDLAAQFAMPLNGEHSDGHSNITYGYLGTADLTMYPLIRPGSVLQIDTRQNKLQTAPWHNEFERPVYFVELRASHACGWCQLQGNKLLIIPHLSSPVRVREFVYPREAEIVGRVIAYYTRCVDSAHDPEQTSATP
jgi:transcriptional regulator with XRE-family HTH domain